MSSGKGATFRSRRGPAVHRLADARYAPDVLNWGVSTPDNPRSAASALRAGGGELVRRARRSPDARDAVNAALFVLLGVILVLWGQLGYWDAAFGGESAARWLHLVPVLLGGLAALLRRRRTQLSAALSVLALAADAALGGSVIMFVIVADALYNVARFAGPRTRRVVYGLAALAAVLLAALGTVTAAREVPFAWSLLQFGALFGVPLWWGNDLRQKSEIADLALERLAVEQARARDRERIALLDRNQSVQAERSRMAADLHDAIASRLSAIALHSGAALAGGTADAGPGRDALQLARASSIAALEDMRAMIVVLRTSELPAGADGASGSAGQRAGSAPTAVAPTASSESLRALTDAAESAGVRVRLRGDAPEGLSAPLGQTLYRIVQESLTNVVKHAPGSAVEISFRAEADGLELRVENELGERLPALPAGLSAALSSGAGLEIMRERAAAFGGRLQAGATDDARRWRVVAFFPLAGAA